MLQESHEAVLADLADFQKKQVKFASLFCYTYLSRLHISAFTHRERDGEQRGQLRNAWKILWAELNVLSCSGHWMS